jgi:glutamate racemase
MKVKGTLGLAVLLVGFTAPSGLVFSSACTTERESKPGLESFFRKKGVTIAVTDSGLGGLSVLAEAARRMKETRVFERADFVFFNALFSNEGGYNSLKTRAEKILVFDSALESLERRCRPDVILIGCNTLSVLFQDTEFAERTRIPVVGIVDSGVELIAAGMRDHPEASVIIFGTPTTISEGTYPRELAVSSRPANLAQACPELETYIESAPRGDETELLITGGVSEAAQKLPAPHPPLLVSLNCTHYGYSLPSWEKAFEEAGIKPLAVLNPNFRMTDVLFEPKFRERYPRTEVRVRVVSMVEIDGRKIDSLSVWLEPLSPETAEGLRGYEHEPSLFEWRSFVSR